MASNAYRGGSVFNCFLKMIVLLILILNTAHFCLGKALIEEAESSRGKRSYAYLSNSGLHQTYDPQSNAEHWMKGGYYEPEVDGQLIHVPSADQLGSYNEFLDAYYKAYTPAGYLQTSVPYTHNTKSAEKTEAKGTLNKKDGFIYTLPTSKERDFSVEMSNTEDYDLQSEDYDYPDVDDSIAHEFNNEKSDISELEDNEFEEPVVRESLKSVLTKPEDNNKYDKPVVKTVKQRTKINNTKKDVPKPSTPKSVYKTTGKTVIKGTSDYIKYESPVPKDREFSIDMSTLDYDLESEDYDDPEIIDRTKASELEEQEKFDETVVRESLKNSEFTKMKQKNHNQYKPVVKTDIQKSNNPKKNIPKPSTPKSVYKTTGKTVIKGTSDYIKHESPVSKGSELSVDMNTPDYDLESEDYDDPEIIDRTKVSELEEQEFDEPVVRESFKNSELTKVKPKNHNRYKPVVKTVIQKPNNPKKDVPKPSTPKSVYKTTGKTVIKGTSDYIKQESPVPKGSELSVDMSTPDYDLESEDYDDPEIIDRTKASELEEQEKFDETVVRESLENSEFTKMKQKNRNQYKPVVKTVIQKPNNPKKDVPKPSTPKSVYKTTGKIVTKGTSGGVKYASPVSKRNEFSVEMSTSDFDLESDDYEDPEIIDRTKISALEEQEKGEESVVRESLKNSELTKTKEHNQYDMPVVKTVKQKPKIKDTKEDLYRKQSAPKITYKSTEKSKTSHKNGIKYGSPALKQSEFSGEMSTSNSDLEDYDDPEVVDKTVVTEFNKVNMKPELGKDDIAEQILRESLKTSELSKTKSKGDNAYMPIVVKRNQKSKSTQTKPQLEGDYEQTETVKTKPNKKPITVSVQKYDKTKHGTLKTGKGKRRKQYSNPNSRTAESEDKNLDSNIKEEETDELNNTPIETPQVTKSKPIRSKEKVVTRDSQYESVTQVAKSNSKDKPMADRTEKPVTTKEKVVATTDLQYQSIKNKKVPIKSDSKDKPVKENVKYDDSEFDSLVKNLNSKDANLTESDMKISNTDKLLEDDLDLASEHLDMSKSELSEKLNSESMTEGDVNLESSSKGVMKAEFISNTNDFRDLSSMNSNIWSMLFNPNAEQNKLKLKKCITRSNETGFCTYIQNCEVPHIATSLEQLLNNACVIDDIFIGVCCPEFPVQTVKVHWDQSASDFDNTIEDEFGHIAEDCGMRSNEALEMQSWPWKAPLVSMSNGKIFCGGVIVSEDHVLTAAHCTTKIPKNQILVRLGQYDDESGDDYAVVEIKRHAQYNPRTMQNDIALLKLGRRIMNDAHIGIVCLPEEDQNNHDGEVATLLGWRGIFGTKSRDPEFLRVISNQECEKKMGMKVLGISLCTETRKENERTCNADSGAPLVIEDDGRYEVIGILSWNRNDCNQRFPSTFSRVSSYTGWIKNHIG